MKYFPTLLVALLISASAFAVIDPDPDMMGIYFDIDANDNCLNIGAIIPFNAYAILTNPTVPLVSAYEFQLRVVVPEGMEGLIFRLAQHSYNGYTPLFPDGFDHPVGDCIVGVSVPYPSEQSTPLHVMQYMLLHVMPVEFYLSAPSTPSIPGDLPIIYCPEGNILMQVGLSTGGPDIPSATVNTDCVVGREKTNFGSVKALFR